ncbi:MAG TPA: carboxypeptidase regulatory-like domain-containing protein [Polyangia bacterium]|nr:carboxypeptidase regulatory-like domain-containing protein [Polyangia bacterium]
MVRRVALAGAAVLGLALWIVPGEARAQKGDSGSIVGCVLDQSGSPLKGIKITTSSATQIGGKKTTYTNEEGCFRFPILDPGTFEVRADAPKLRTVIQQNVKVGINAPADVNLIMEVASDKVEEVKVVEKAPLVNTSSASVKEVFDLDFVDSLPHENRDVIFQQVTNYSAGSINGRIRGGAAAQTIYTMDGFNLFREYPTVKASAAYEIQTAGYGAENVMASGGVVNLVSRSGSNKFELELGATVDHDRLTFFRDGLDTRNPSHFYIFNPTIAGPIIKDKLWYAANVEFLTRLTGRDPDPERILPDPPPELRNWYKGTVKLTWQVSSRNKLSSVTTFDEFWRHNTRELGYDKDAQETSRQHKSFTGLIWESVLTDAVIFRSQAGVARANSHNSPDSCLRDPGMCDFVAATKQTFPKSYTYGNAINHSASNADFFQFINRLEFFLNSKSLGEHDVQVKDNLMLQRDVNYKSEPGDALYELNGLDKLALTTYYSNDPRYEEERKGWFITNTNSLRNALTLSDAWRPSRYLTITPGAAFTVANASNSRGDEVFAGQALTPSLSVAWDATHDGRTVLRGSVAEYLDVELTTIAGHTLGSQVSKRCLWNPDTQAYDRTCVFSGGATSSTIASPCGPSGVDVQGNDCHGKLKIPRTWEYTAGFEREVIQGLALGTSVVYRKYSNQFETMETNRIWNGPGTDVVSYRDGRQHTVMDLETPEGANRRYVGVTGSVAKREGRLKMQADYTWSRLDGTVLDGSSNRYGDIAPRDAFLYGSLPDDHRHELKTNLSYRATSWLSVGARYTYISGTPYNRLFRNDVTGSFENQEAPIGVNPGTNVNDPTDDRELRLPDQHTLSAQLAFNLQPLIGIKFETFVDVLNVLGSRTTTSVTENDGPSFGQLSARMAPMRIRLGARYRF